MKEEVLYEPIRKWLRSKGYKALITGNRKEVSIFVGDILPAKANIEPDVVGITDSYSDNVCVEAKAEIDSIFDVIGKCKIWQLASRHVYLAVPPSDGFKTEGLAAMGVGLLFVSENSVEEVLKPNYYGTNDSAKSEELFNQAFRAIKSHYGVLDRVYPQVASKDDCWEVKFAAKNIGSKPIKIIDVLLDGLSFSARRCKLHTNEASRQILVETNGLPVEVMAGRSYEFLLEIPKEGSSKSGIRISVDFRLEDAVEKGSSLFLPS